MSEMNPSDEKPKLRTGWAPLDAFMEHQRRGINETGRAFASLLPKDFRTHAGNAVEEMQASWAVLLDGAIETLKGRLDKMKPTPDDDTGKVKVEVE